MAPGSPGGPPDALLRPRLLRVLARRFDRRLIAVQAPAGFGKSTLLAQAMRENALAPRGVDVLLTCRREHAAPAVFVRDLAAAVGATCTGQDDVTTMVREAAAALASRSPVDVAVIVDDVHLTRHGQVAAILERLLTELPSNAHLVLSGRDGVIATARLEMSGQALRLGEAELRFTAEELAEFAALRGVDRQALAQTGGWPAVAELTARAGPGRAADYVWEETLAGLSERQRRILRTLVLLGGGDTALVSAAQDDDVRLPHDLGGVPLVTITPDGWCIPHALWSTTLGTVLSAAEERQVRVRGAHELRQRGELVPAMRLLLDARAADEARELIRVVCARAVPDAPADLLQRWHDTCRRPHGEARKTTCCSALPCAPATRSPAHDISPRPPTASGTSGTRTAS